MLLSRLQTVEHLNLGGLTKKQELSNLGELDLTLCKFRVMDVETTWLFQAQILNGGNCSNMMNLNSFSPMSKIKEFYKLQTTTEKVTMLLLVKDKPMPKTKCGRLSMLIRLKKLELRVQTKILVLISTDHST
jgi:hypothetical protein